MQAQANTNSQSNEQESDEYDDPPFSSSSPLSCVSFNADNLKKNQLAFRQWQAILIEIECSEQYLYLFYCFVFPFKFFDVIMVIIAIVIFWN